MISIVLLLLPSMLFVLAVERTVCLFRHFCNSFKFQLLRALIDFFSCYLSAWNSSYCMTHVPYFENKQEVQQLPPFS